MTLVTIDITGVASSTGPDDRVVLRAPTIREKTGGGLVSTREEVVHLVEGVGDIELAPGPVMVKFLCEGVSDTGEKMGVVPEDGPLDLLDVLADSLDYPTPVVAAAQQERNDTIRAAEESAARVWDATKNMREATQRDAERAALMAGASGVSAQAADQSALSAWQAREMTEQDTLRAERSADAAIAAAWQASMTTVGVNVTEIPAGSGLWLIGEEELSIIEDPDSTGLYTIGVI